MAQITLSLGRMNDNTKDPDLSSAPELSFEYFPPRSDAIAQRLTTTAAELATLGPGFCSVTYGAGGTTREATLGTVRSLAEETAVETVPHLAALGSTEAEVSQLLADYVAMGVRRIVALRGDLPADPALPPLGADAPMAHGADLVRLIRSLGYQDLTLYVAAYPEAHPESADMGQEVTYFEQKVSEGADAAITQYFFNADAYARFLDAIAARGIDIPVIAGIMPIYDFEQITRFSALCGAEIPRWLTAHISAYSDPESQRDYAADVVAALCERLIALGAPGFHFYTLNRSEPTAMVIDRAGLRGN